MCPRRISATQVLAALALSGLRPAVFPPTRCEADPPEEACLICLADGLQDHLISVAIGESAETGRDVDRLVAPGLVPPATKLPESGARAQDVVWAARFSEDKNPTLFLEALAGAAAHGAMYGTGPLEQQIRERAPANVEVLGWRAREEIWESARAYVGTSSREAFGRSAVEAAMLGIPVILSDVFGCADMLYTDDALREALVLSTSDTARWRDAISRLTSDDEFHTMASAHVRQNAARLTIDSAVDNVVAASTEVISGSPAHAPS